MNLNTIDCINRTLADGVRTRLTSAIFLVLTICFDPPAAGYSSKSIKIETSSLDLSREQKNESSIDFIKISSDTDLLAAWKGMQSILALSPDIKILCSIHPGSQALLDEIEKSGFKYFLLPTLSEVDRTFFLSQSQPKTAERSRSAV